MVTQETDQSYGPFQSRLQTNLQLVIEERIHAEKSTNLAPWIVGLMVFGGTDPETGLIVGSAFQDGFNKTQNLHGWAKGGAVPLTRTCLQNTKVWCTIGDGTDDQQAATLLIVEHNVLACNALTLEGYNGDIMKIAIKPITRMIVITCPHLQAQIELLSQAKAHGNIFAATEGTHLTLNNIFKGIVLKHQKLLREKLAKEKTMHEQMERNELNSLAILERRGGGI